MPTTSNNKTPKTVAKPIAVKQVTVTASRKPPVTSPNVVGTSDAYKARVDSTNKANIAANAIKRKARL